MSCEILNRIVIPIGRENGGYQPYQVQYLQDKSMRYEPYDDFDFGSTSHFEQGLETSDAKHELDSFK